MTVVKDTIATKKVAPTISRKSALVALVGGLLGAFVAPAAATVPAPAPRPAPGTVSPDGISVISYLPDGTQVKITDISAEFDRLAEQAAPAKDPAPAGTDSEQFARYLSNYTTKDCPSDIDPLDWRALLAAAHFYLGTPSVCHSKLWSAAGRSWQRSIETGDYHIFGKTYRLISEGVEKRGMTLEESFIEFLRLRGVENPTETFWQKMREAEEGQL